MVIIGRPNPNAASEEDARLVSAVCNGDSRAFGMLYDRHIEAVYRYIFFRVANQQDAEDLTQKLFLNLLESLRNPRSPIVELKPYLYRSAHNLVIDYYRRRKPTTDTPLSLSTPVAEDVIGIDASLEDQVIISQDHAVLAAAIARLKKIDQHVITCRFINHWSVQETARLIGVTENHLRVIQFRAIQKLRIFLTNERGKDV